MPSKNKFEISGDDIHIYGEGWNKIAKTTYREDYYDELTSVTWTAENGYLKNAKLGYLHRYIMGKWYGEDMVSDMLNKNIIVDHMKNDGFDCRISNLEFLIKSYNTAKGQILDVNSKDMKYHIALNLFKDFDTGLYQITIGFNDDVWLVDNINKTKRSLKRLKLLYNCDYRIVINDAEGILLDYQTQQVVNIDKLRCIECKPAYGKFIHISENQANQAFFIIDGELYYRPGNGVWITEVPYEKGWYPNQKPKEEK